MGFVDYVIVDFDGFFVICCCRCVIVVDVVVFVIVCMFLLVFVVDDHLRIIACSAVKKSRSHDTHYVF